MDDLNTIGLAVTGWLASGWLGFRLGLHSQKLQREYFAKAAIRAKRNEFVAYLKAWKVEFDRLHMVSHGYRRNPSALVDAMPDFIHQAELIRVDISGDKKNVFENLVATITSRGPRDFDNGERYKNLLSEIDQIIALVESA